MQKLQKKGVMGEIVGLFILVLVIAVIVGMTFLFVAQLKTQVQNTATDGVNSTAYKAVNSTEAAGYTTVGYLPLVFLAIIFSAVLLLVLKMILPYVNLSSNVGGF